MRSWPSQPHGPRSDMSGEIQLTSPHQAWFRGPRRHLSPSTHHTEQYGPMKTLGTNAQDMQGMFAACAARPASGFGDASAYRWHRIPSIAVLEVFADTTKLPARRLSEAPL